MTDRAPAPSTLFVARADTLGDNRHRGDVRLDLWVGALSRTGGHRMCDDPRHAPLIRGLLEKAEEAASLWTRVFDLQGEVKRLKSTSTGELTEQVIRLTSERDALAGILRDLAAAEGDSSLHHQVAIWRHRCEGLEQNVRRLTSKRQGSKAA